MPLTETTTKKKHSKAFDAYLEFGKKIAEATGKVSVTDKDGNTSEKNEYYISSFKTNTFTEKDTEKTRIVGEFFLNGRKGESLALQFSLNGVLMNATIMRENGSREFVGKNFAKLQEKVTDKGLAEMASKLDWTKVPSKDQEQTQEQDGPELD